MKFKRSKQRGALEQIPTHRPGDRVMRRQRKRRGIFHNTLWHIARLFKHTANK